MTADDPGSAALRAKASFDHIYDRPDPRPYFVTLGELGYRELEHAQRVVEVLLEHLPARRGTPTVLDVCCSYGMLGALLRCGITLDDLVARYRRRSGAEWPTERVAADDRDYLAQRRTRDEPVVLGVDAAEVAVTYGTAVGALDGGWAEDLERSQPSPSLREALRGVDLVTVAGGVGYVTERTFDRLLDAGPQPPPWVAALVARFYPYDRIAATLAEHGLVTERLTTRTFPRRRFADDRERTDVLARLADLGIDPTGREADGWYHAELYLSRPGTAPDGLPQPPVDDLLAGLPA
jgi:hypothetical protein